VGETGGLLFANAQTGFSIGGPGIAMSRSGVTRAELVAYATELLTDAMNDGFVEPIVLIECVQYATKPTLLSALRAISLLDESGQAEILQLAQRLSRQARPLN
jgi:hypothetical protein